MDKLPKVFANPINKELKNNEDLFRSDKKVEIKSSNIKDINKKINQIFGSNSHIYKSKVKITLKDGDLVTDIVGQSSSNLLTLDGKLIRISDIIDIEKL